MYSIKETQQIHTKLFKASYMEVNMDGPSNCDLSKLACHVSFRKFSRSHLQGNNTCICTDIIVMLKWEYNEEVHQLFIDLKKAYDSVRREIL